MCAIKLKSTHPSVSSSTKFPFQVSVACWIDLLGYGQMIGDAEFNPLHPKAKEALHRLRRFHEIVASRGARYFPTLVMNDGAVAYRDLSLRTQSVTHDFLMRAWDLFSAIKKAESEHNLPGARMVLACGFRMRGRRAGVDRTSRHLLKIIDRFEAGSIDAKQAIIEAASTQRYFDIVPQLQANFAFTKAYLAESSGQAGGLSGANFYVDLTLFRRPLPDWIQLGPEVNWSHPRLGLPTTFAAVLNLPVASHPAGGPTELLDGLQVARELARDPDVLEALRAASKSSRPVPD